MRSLLIVIFVTISALPAAPQKRPATQTVKTATNKTRPAEIGQTAVVIDETLSVLRDRPSLFALSIQRMQRGRKIQIMGVAEADGVKFYKVIAPPRNYGWVQAEAVFGKFRPGDEERLARLVRAYDGFDQIEIATKFFELYPDSKLRPPILLLFGDLLEDVAAKLSKDARSRLKDTEIAASGAPAYSHYLNFNMLDRYRKIGITFVFNSAVRQYHYNGEAWTEIVEKYPAANEAAEAKKRLASLKQKLEMTSAK